MGPTSSLMSGVRSKTTLYVGGLEESVTEGILHAAFLPFGDVKDVSIPLNNEEGKGNRGFGFVEYQEREDAAAAMDNMNEAELFGRVLKVNFAQPMKAGKGTRAIWDVEADDFFAEQEAAAEAAAQGEGDEGKETPDAVPS